MLPSAWRDDVDLLVAELREDVAVAERAVVVALDRALDERGLEQQVLRRIAADRQLRKEHQVRPGRDRLVDAEALLAALPGERFAVLQSGEIVDQGTVGNDDALQRIRFEHPEVRSVIVTSGKDRVFCAGANIFMLGVAWQGGLVPVSLAASTVSPGFLLNIAWASAAG